MNSSNAVLEKENIKENASPTLFESLYLKIRRLRFWRRLHAELRLKKSLIPVPIRTVDIELTNHCNQKCVFCPTGLGTLERPKGMMDMRTFKKIADQLPPRATIQFAGYGEPFLNNQLEDFLDYANGLGLANIEIYSNLAALTENRLRGLLDHSFQKLVISLDGMSKEAFAAYKGCDQFEKVMENIKILSDEVKKRGGIKQQLVVQMVTTKFNISQGDQFKDQVTQLGLTPALKSLNTHISHSPEEKIENFEVAEKSRYLNRKGYSKKCHWIWGGMLIFWNGDVTICCQDPTGGEIYGNLFDTSLSDLLNIDMGRIVFRSQYYDDPGQLDICMNCQNA